jgi:hypothetical protein
MTVTQRDQVDAEGDPDYPEQPASGVGAWGRRRLLGALAWGSPFAVVLGILLARNRWMFSVPVSEDADMGAYSIQVEQARRFALLVGNYSREGFNHPGPAFLYVQAWGEDLFYDLLRVVPAAWNGEVVGLYLLSAFFAACAVVVARRWGGARAGLVTLGAVGLYGALHPSVFSSDWMPYEYAPVYLAFVVSVASVAGGRTRDAWIAALSGWFLIHGHACFLLFVPLLALSAVAARLVPYLRWRTWPRPEWRAWLPVAVISAVFALPIAVELALHWPGNFGKYFAYSGSAQSGGHPAAQVVHYVLWFWWPHRHAWAVAAVLVTAAAVAAWVMPYGPLRRFCLALLAVNAVSTVAFAVYAAVGIDELNQYYIGYFYWSAPVIMILVLALAVTELLAAGAAGPGSPWVRAVSGIAAVLALAGCAAFAVAPQTRLTTEHADPGSPAATGPVADPALPLGVAWMAALAARRYMVISFPHDAWPAVTGILVQAERTGVPACVIGGNWKFMMTSQFICTSAEARDGRSFSVWVPGSVPRGMPVVFRLRRGIVTYGTK